MDVNATPEPGRAAAPAAGAGWRWRSRSWRLLGTWAWGRLHPAAPGAGAGAAATAREAIVRRTEVAFADAAGGLAPRCRDGSGDRYDPARARLLHPRHRDRPAPAAPRSPGRSTAPRPGPPPST